MDLGTPSWGMYGMQKLQEQISANAHGPRYPLVGCVPYFEIAGAVFCQPHPFGALTCTTTLTFGR